jgi:exonuclease III
MSLRFVTANVRGLGDQGKRAQLRLHLGDLENGLGAPDVLFLQELHIGDKDPERWLCDLQGRYTFFLSPGAISDPAAGTGIALKRDSFTDAELVEHDLGGRWTVVRATFPNVGEVVLASVYAPASANDATRRSFFSSLPWALFRGKAAVLAGDWNCIIKPSDRVQFRPVHGPAFDPEGAHKHRDAQKLAKLLSRHGFRDVRDHAAQLQAPAQPTHVWAGREGLEVTSEAVLDRLYITWELSTRICSYQVEPLCATISDHRPASFELSAPGPSDDPQGPGLWRLDPRLVRLKEFREAIESLHQRAMDDPLRLQDPCAWYNELIRSIQCQAQVIDTWARGRRRQRLREARERVAEATTNLHANPGNAQAKSALSDALSALTACEEEHLLRLRSLVKAKWLLTSERPTAAFYRMVQRRRRDRTRLGPIAGAESPLLKARLAAVHKYYQQLFRKRDPSAAHVRKLLDRLTGRLDPEARRKLEQPLRREELVNASRAMALGKAPGLDGLCIELYRECPFLLDSLLLVWESCLARSEPLPWCMRGGVVTLLHKKGPADQLDNYRPITLLTCAYKLVAKALTARLRPHVAKVVGPHQTGFIPRRDIRSNILEAHLALKAAKAQGVSGALLFFDFQKAYDRLDREFLFSTMAKKGFGPNFINFVRLLNLGASAVVMVNRHFTDVISLDGGVRQGCPLSPLLFAIATEPLRAALHSRPTPGLRISGLELRATLYADDLTGFVGSQSSFEQCTECVDDFCKAACMEVNVVKSRALCFGSSPPRTAPLRSMDRGEAEVLLGSRIGHESCDGPLWDSIKQKIDDKLGKYKRFNPSVFGRALLANSLVFSHLWYAVSFSCPPDGLLEKLWKQAMHFVYDKNPGIHHLSFDFSRLPKAEGGLGVLDPRLEAQAIRATWVSRLVFAEDAPWRHLLWYELMDCCLELAQSSRSFNFLSHEWGKVRRDPNRHPLRTLALEILGAFSALDPRQLPPLGGILAFDFQPAEHRWDCSNRPAIPASDLFAETTVCGGLVPLEKLTVKAAYKYLLQKAVAASNKVVPLLLPLSVHKWPRRWAWLCKSGLPMNVRQLVWRRWHDKLYLGATSEDPNPSCVFCSAQASSWHFVHECRVGKEALAFLRCVWRHWTGKTFPTSWWDDEWASKEPAWNACFAFLVHALYRVRVEVVKGERIIAPMTAVTRIFRSSLEIQLQSLTWHQKILDRPLHDRWILGGAWLQPSDHHNDLTVCVTWPSPPF